MDQRLRDIIAAVFGVDASGLSDEDSPQTIPQWDSVTHLQLIIALEEEFGIQFSPDEVADLASVALIRRRLEHAAE